MHGLPYLEQTYLQAPALLLGTKLQPSSRRAPTHLSQPYSNRVESTNFTNTLVDLKVWVPTDMAIGHQEVE